MGLVWSPLLSSNPKGPHTSNSRSLVPKRYQVWFLEPESLNWGLSVPFGKEGSQFGAPPVLVRLPVFSHDFGLAFKDSFKTCAVLCRSYQVSEPNNASAAPASGRRDSPVCKIGTLFAHHGLWGVVLCCGLPAVPVASLGVFQEGGHTGTCLLEGAMVGRYRQEASFACMSFFQRCECKLFPPYALRLNVTIQVLNVQCILQLCGTLSSWPYKAVPLCSVQGIEGGHCQTKIYTAYGS